MTTTLLRNGVTLKDLEEGVEFEVDADNAYSSEDEFFDNEAYNRFKDDMIDVDGKHKPKFVGGSDIPFHELKETMTPVADDQKVLKEVLKCGIGPVIPDKAVVLMHYDAFVEGRKEAFDSTRLRNKPFKFLIGDGNIVFGLETGIKTMKKEEISRFIIDPEYAYGDMGCPPRIPAKAEILYEVEIMNFYDGKDAVEYEELPPEEQKKAPFEKIVGVYYCENQMANDLFHKKQYREAISRYRRIATLLERTSVGNEEDDDKRKGYLLKIYLNLAQACLNIGNLQKAIIYADLALRLDPQNPKGLYRMGIALSRTDDHERGLFYLNQAKKYKPYEKSINIEIQRLESRRKMYQDYERGFSRRALGFVEDDSKVPEAIKESPEFIKLIEEEIKVFLESDETEKIFSPGYTESQLEVVKIVAQNHDLAFVSKIQCGLKINKVAKKH